MKLSVFLMLIGMMQVSANVYSQAGRINVQVSQVALSDLLWELQENSEVVFVYKTKDLQDFPKVSIDKEGALITEILDELLQDSDLEYKLDEDVVVIKKKLPKQNIIHQEAVNQQEFKKVKGTVTDKEGNTLPGVSVVLKGTTRGVITDGEGKFSIVVDDSPVNILVFSYIGMAKKEVKITEQLIYNVTLKTENSQIGEVVVNGYFNKAKESFTGTATTVTSEELVAQGTASVLTALQSFDPSFKIVENSEWGSDPNALPDMNIRGQGGFPAVSEAAWVGSTNMPTFILDGFQVSPQEVFDMDINDIASATILKDASAAAIYGSRAANGVVVIERKLPKLGKLKFSYNLDGEMSFANLDDYNLLDAAGKLELEKRRGLYSSENFEERIKRENKYNELYNEIKSGVNTNWLAQPLQTAINQRHSLRMEGGNESIRFGLSAGVNKEDGVMKGSGRNRYNLSSFMLYRLGNLTFRNNLSVSSAKGENSPYGSFRVYATLNPYYRIYDENGKPYEVLGEHLLNEFTPRQNNPIHDAEETASYSRNNYSQISNSFSVNWAVVEGLRLKGNVSISQNVAKSELYKSADHSGYSKVSMDESHLNGEKSISRTEVFTYQTNVLLAYYKNFGKHLINANLGGELRESKRDNTGHRAVGFVTDKMDHISFALAYPDRGRPSGGESSDRQAGSFLNLNYTYGGKYLLDMSARIDGSSKFGKFQKTAPFWSLGIGWNAHKEAFMTNNVLSKLKITANVGTSGTQNFSSYNAITTYQYLKEQRYNHLIGATLMGLGNEDLKWQTVLSSNLGLEVSLWNDRVSIKANYYNKLTRDLLTKFSTAPSVGFPEYFSNRGDVSNRGYELFFNIVPIRTKDFTISFNVNAAHNKNRIEKISESLKVYNDRLIENMQNALNNPNSGAATLSLIRKFEEGKSLNTLYTVKSLGIDPATGREVFLTREGSKTYDWRPQDIVSMGESTPLIRGYFGGNLFYKGLSFSFTMGYSYGGKILNSTVLRKIENANISYNTDRRVLEERWNKVGELSYYKGIKLKGKTHASSRFIEDNDFLHLNNMRLGYNLPESFSSKLGMSRLKLAVNIRDIYRWSTVRIERGLSYPYAKKVNFSVKANF